MKSPAFVLIALVCSMILTSIPAQIFAEPQLDSLLSIVKAARDNIDIRLSQITTIPNDISAFYKQGSSETEALAQSVEQGDVSSSKEHFLSAMKLFKEINDKISSQNPTITNNQPNQNDITQLKSEITRLKNTAERLQEIAIKNSVNIDLTKFNELMQAIQQNIDTGNMDQAKQDIQTANQFILDAHHALADAANQKTSDRAKEFTEKQIVRFDKLTQVEKNATQNMPHVSASAVSTVPENTTEVSNTQEMVIKLRQLLSQGKIEEALQTIKSINEELDKEKINSQGMQNETNSNESNVTQSHSNSTTTLPSNSTVQSNVTQSHSNSTITPPSNTNEQFNNVNNTIRKHNDHKEDQHDKNSHDKKDITSKDKEN